MTKECLWYNGELGYYELLDFDPNGLTKKEVISKATKSLKQRYMFEDKDMPKVLETLYLMDIDDLEKVV